MTVIFLYRAVIQILSSTYISRNFGIERCPRSLPTVSFDITHLYMIIEEAARIKILRRWIQMFIESMTWFPCWCPSSIILTVLCSFHWSGRPGGDWPSLSPLPSHPACAKTVHIQHWIARNVKGEKALRMNSDHPPSLSTYRFMRNEEGNHGKSSVFHLHSTIQHTSNRSRPCFCCYSGCQATVQPRMRIHPVGSLKSLLALFLTWIKFFASLFNGNYGLSIILMTILVRLALMPMMMKQYRNQLVMKEKMNVIQPELKKIQRSTKQAERSWSPKKNATRDDANFYQKHEFIPQWRWLFAYAHPIAHPVFILR